MNPGEKIAIGAAHRRGIGAALRLLEKALGEFEEYARGREVHAVLFEERNDLPEERKRALLDAIGPMRSLLREIRDVLGLGVEVESVSRRLFGQGAALQEILAGTTSESLRRYGNVPVGLSLFLDRRIETLKESLGSIAGPTRMGSSPPEEDGGGREGKKEDGTA